MDTQQTTSTFISPYSLEEAKQRLKVNPPSGKKNINQPATWITIRTYPQNDDTLKFSMSHLHRYRDSLISSMDIPNPEKAAQMGEKYFGKMQGILSRQADGTTLIKVEFSWQWWQAALLTLYPTLIILLISIALWLGIHHRWFVYFWGLVMLVLFGQSMMLFAQHLLVRRKLLKTLKKALDCWEAWSLAED